MVGYHQRHTAEWLAYFARRGHTAVCPLGAGVEGAVYQLDDDLVANVWSGRPPAKLAPSRQVYADIADNPLPFATPRILDVEVRDGVIVTYERILTGAPFRTEPVSPPPDRDLPAAETAALLTVLRALATVAGTDAMRRLTVHGDDRPFWRDHERFPDALAALVLRANPPVRGRVRPSVGNARPLPGGLRPSPPMVCIPPTAATATSAGLPPCSSRRCACGSSAR